MPPRMRLVYSILVGTFLVLAALPIVREIARPGDIWWTPRALMVPLERAGDRVEIYAGGQALGALLAGGQLRMGEGAETRALTASDFGVRFNNSDRVRAERLPALLVSAALCGALVTLLLLVITGRLVYRDER